MLPSPSPFTFTVWWWRHMLTHTQTHPQINKKSVNSKRNETRRANAFVASTAALRVFAFVLHIELIKTHTHAIHRRKNTCYIFPYLVSLYDVCMCQLVIAEHCFLFCMFSIHNIYIICPKRDHFVAHTRTYSYMLDARRFALICKHREGGRRSFICILHIYIYMGGWWLAVSGLSVCLCQANYLQNRENIHELFCEYIFGCNLLHCLVISLFANLLFELLFSNIIYNAMQSIPILIYMHCIVQLYICVCIYLLIICECFCNNAFLWGQGRWLAHCSQMVCVFLQLFI